MTTAATTASSCVITLNNKTASFRLFGPARPFDLSTRAGMEAFNQSSKALDKTFGGDVNDWPEFLTDLQLRASRVKWDAAAPNGILTMTSPPQLNSMPPTGIIAPSKTIGHYT